MKSAVLFLLFAAAVCAQVIPSAGVSPEIPDSEVIAVFEDGHQFTMAEFRAVFVALLPQAQRAAMTDRAQWIHQYALTRKLAGLAEREKLHEMTPVKEILEWQRTNLLAQLMISAQANATAVDSQEIVKAYEASKDKHKQVKVRIIYIAFLSKALLESGSKGLSEDQAQAKAASLVAQIRKGADFIKLVKANSDDKDSREKDGEFSTMRATDNVSAEIKEAVFSLKQGAVSEPVRQPNGFYIFKADEVSVRPLSEVRDEIYTDVKMAKQQRWMSELNSSVKVEMKSDKFFKPAQPAPPPPAPAPKPPAK